MKRKPQINNIVVIGNAPFDENVRLGSVIDGFDLVVRMNNYKTKGYEEFVGSKTDIWVNGMNTLNGRSDETLQILAVSPLAHRHALFRGIMINPPKNLKLVSAEQLKKVYQDMGYEYDATNPHPSTGMFALRTIIDEYPDADVYMHNFNFFMKSVDGTNDNHHYWGEDEGYDTTHKFDATAHPSRREMEYVYWLKHNKGLKWLK